jgi:NAD(P)H dehydrogenase (quinone)
MPKILVLYYSSYGHIETMALALAAGARLDGAEVVVKRVPETVPLSAAQTAHFKLDQSAPIAVIDELADYDAIVVGCPTRFGRMCAQMATFLDQAGGLWMRGALNGKVGVGLPYSHQGQMTLDELVGGSPYGATTIAGAAGQRKPSALDLEGAKHQGALIAKTALKLFA